MARFSTQLTGAHVLVTGGSKGIGKVIVESFLAEGANVSYCARTVRHDQFSSLKDTTDGARVVGSNVDISDPESIKAWVEKSAEEFGRIDVVVANACPGYSEATLEDWQKSFQSDVLGLWTLIDVATPHLEKRGGTGSIVVISSVAGFVTKHPGIGGPYSVVKRAQATMATDLSRKLGPQGIRINTVVPGGIETASLILPDGTEQLSTFGAIRKDNPEFIESIIKAVPLGTLGESQDVANAVVYLGSGLAKYVHGTKLFVDGGVSGIL
ncbi:hypothetical protein AK830_g5176 [Neonectria ditissima]|uniref:Uncharacterized protein n=1 Tax=Neonectria ditissima TaxID=78410 RepID=A0A0P7BES9_9HYPO|nr:hypothetical protein AK830_g5176 [Neonectria ditissima]